MNGSDVPVTLIDAAAWGKAALSKYSDNPARDAHLLLALATGRPREHIHLHPEDRAGESVMDRYRFYVERRKNGEPIAYIRGYQPFMGHDFLVDERVLIPRPETEVLVEEVVRFMMSGGAGHIPGAGKAVVADICCGSGAIGLSIAKACPGVNVVMTDLSEGAIGVARQNAIRLGVLCGETAGRVVFLRGDLLEPLRGGCLGGLDVIASNPPYIDSLSMEDLPVEVKYEPRTALDGGPGGLRHILRLVDEGIGFLRPGGMMAVEIDEDQAGPVEKAFRESGWTGSKFVNDLAGRIRVAIAYRDFGL